MHIQDFFQNFLKLFLVGLHGDCTISLIAQDMSPWMDAVTSGDCNNFTCVYRFDFGVIRLRRICSISNLTLQREERNYPKL